METASRRFSDHFECCVGRDLDPSRQPYRARTSEITRCWRPHVHSHWHRELHQGSVRRRKRIHQRSPYCSRTGILQSVFCTCPCRYVFYIFRQNRVKNHRRILRHVFRRQQKGRQRCAIGRKNSRKGIRLCIHTRHPSDHDLHQDCSARVRLTAFMTVIPVSSPSFVCFPAPVNGTSPDILQARLSGQCLSQ